MQEPDFCAAPLVEGRSMTSILLKAFADLGHGGEGDPAAKGAYLFEHVAHGRKLRRDEKGAGDDSTGAAVDVLDLCLPAKLVGRAAAKDKQLTGDDHHAVAAEVDPADAARLQLSQALLAQIRDDNQRGKALPGGASLNVVRGLRKDFGGPEPPHLGPEAVIPAFPGEGDPGIEPGVFGAGRCFHLFNGERRQPPVCAFGDERGSVPR